MDKVLYGKPISAMIRTALKELIRVHELEPRMALIQIGEDPASSYYIQNIIKNGSMLGCRVELHSLSADVSQDILAEHIKAANNDPCVHGIMLQKPLPAHIDDSLTGALISPQKDLDCLNPFNLGSIILEADGLLPCTPLAVLYTLINYGIPTQGKHVVIIGRSSIVGKPLANMLLWKKPYANASVTVCHSQTSDLNELTASADILVAALGKAEFVKADMIKENCVLIDVGINEVKTIDGKTNFVGDIDYNSCFDKALAITPVPGGIGTVTSSLLFLNLVKASLSAKGVNKTIDDFIGLIFDDN